MTILLSMMISFQIKAQVRSRAIVSPEVHDDQTVTFRMTAREADTVILLLPDVNINKVMRKNESGVWSTTIGPFGPEGIIYLYTSCMGLVAAQKTDCMPATRIFQICLIKKALNILFTQREGLIPELFGGYIFMKHYRYYLNDICRMKG